LIKVICTQNSLFTISELYKCDQVLKASKNGQFDRRIVLLAKII